MSEIDKMYQKQILEEAKKPFHFEKMEEAEVRLRAFNPICGDRFDLYMNKATLYFHGFGCTISKAATSFMLRELEGKSKVEALAIINSFMAEIDHGKEITIPSLRVFEKKEHFEGRIDCILIAWKTMQKYLLNDDEHSQEN